MTFIKRTGFILLLPILCILRVFKLHGLVYPVLTCMLKRLLFVLKSIFAIQMTEEKNSKHLRHLV